MAAWSVLRAASINDPDIFKISLIWPIIQKLETTCHKKYEDNAVAMRVIADHMRAACFLALDGVTPSNKGQGYVMRRLLRRAIRYALEIGIEQAMCETIAPLVIDCYKDDYIDIGQNAGQLINSLVKEEKIFRQTLRKGLKMFERLLAGEADKHELSGEDIFLLYDTYGFPVELSAEEAKKRGLTVAVNADSEFDRLMTEQRERSRTATAGEFKGGLADVGEMTTKLHTAAHLLDAALHLVLGDSVSQRGSNINAERLRFDFSHPEKVNQEQILKIEQIVNDAIDQDLPVNWSEEPTDQAFKSGAIGAFGHKYGDKVKGLYYW